MPAPVDEAPAQRLTLAAFETPDAPPDDYVQPPSKGAEAAAPPAGNDKPPAQAEPTIRPLVEEPDDKPDDKPEPDPDAKPAGDPDPEAGKTLSDAFEDPEKVARRDAAAKAEEDKKTAEAAAAEKAKADGTPLPAVERDSDLKVEHAAHTHPKTRKIITDFQTKARAARDERDAAVAKATELEKRVAAAEEKAKTIAVPESTEKELKDLRERVRELDISKDPAIQQKYDAKIESNNNAIIATLKAQGFGKVKKDGSDDFVDNPAVVNALLKSGLTMKTLQPYIKQLEEAELIDEAEAIRDAVRENNRIARDRQQEIESWKGDFSKRQQERATVARQTQEQQDKLYRQQTDLQLRTDLDELRKQFPHLNEPPKPLPTDIPATQKAKQAAIDEWTAASKAVEAAVKGFEPTGVSPEKMPEVVGRINAAAIQSQVYRFHVIPKLTKELAALTARAKELEAELGRIKDAGKLSRLQAGTASDAGFNGRPEPKSLEEAFVDPTRG